MKKKIKERRPVRRGGERGDQRRRGGEVVGFHQEEPGCCHPQRIWACKKFKIPFFILQSSVTLLLLARLVHTNWPIGTCTLQTEMHGRALWYVHASVAFFWSRAPSFSDFKIMGLTPNSFLLLLPTCCIVSHLILAGIYYFKKYKWSYFYTHQERQIKFVHFQFQRTK